MGTACFSTLSNVECCKLVFSQKQQGFIIKYYFLTKLCNKVRKQYEKQFPDANLPSNKAINCVIRKFENEKAIDDLPHSRRLTVWSVEKTEDVRKHMWASSHTSSRQLALCAGLWHISTYQEMYKATEPRHTCSFLLIAFMLQSLHSKGTGPSILFRWSLVSFIGLY